MVIVVQSAAPEDTQSWATIEFPAQGIYRGERRALNKKKDSEKIWRMKKYMVDSTNQ